MAPAVGPGPWRCRGAGRDRRRAGHPRPGGAGLAYSRWTVLGRSHSGGGSDATVVIADPSVSDAHAQVYRDGEE